MERLKGREENAKLIMRLPIVQKCHLLKSVCALLSTPSHLHREVTRRWQLCTVYWGMGECAHCAGLLVKLHCSAGTGPEG